MSDQDPLAVIKVTFDELPEDIKQQINVFLGAGVTCLILTNIMLISKLIKFYYYTFNSRRQINGYEPV
jgi:hypothetical protein